MTMTIIIFEILGVGLAILSGLICWLLKTKRMTLPFLYKYNPGYTLGVISVTNPLDINEEKVNVLVKSQFRMHPLPMFMADPFVVKENDMYYIFYEELSAKYCHFGGADICVLQSEDGVSWRRLGNALHEPFHLSFPNVFRWKGDWYMLPEAHFSGEMRLYKAADFPMKWGVYAILKRGVAYADPMIYEQDGIWYLWYNTYLDGDNLVLFMSDSLMGNWIEHPASPIRINGDDTRPAGRMNLLDGKLVYFVQSHQYGYGTGTIAYEIDTLSKTEYRDHRLDTNPILWRNGNGWARDGMHHMSYIMEADGTYLCAVDGLHSSPASWRWDWLNLPSFNFRKK